jgi:hypothetical protein
VPRSRQPLEPPNFFVDRSLGRYLVPDGLRQAGFDVHTMTSVYGPGAEERVADEVWLERAGREGWVVLTKDERIRRNAPELSAVEEHRVKVFYLSAGSLTRAPAARSPPGERCPHRSALATAGAVDLRRPCETGGPGLALSAGRACHGAVGEEDSSLPGAPARRCWLGWGR